MMATTVSQRALGQTVETQSGTAAADSLNLRDAVFGDGLILTEDESNRYVLHTLEAGQSRLLGVFTSPADALSALDAYELAD
jgi:hypothetical protein